MSHVLFAAVRTAVISIRSFEYVVLLRHGRLRIHVLVRYLGIDS